MSSEWLTEDDIVKIVEAALRHADDGLSEDDLVAMLERLKQMHFDGILADMIRDGNVEFTWKDGDFYLWHMEAK